MKKYLALVMALVMFTAVFPVNQCFAEYVDPRDHERIDIDKELDDSTGNSKKDLVIYAAAAGGALLLGGIIYWANKKKNEPASFSNFAYSVNRTLLSPDSRCHVSFLDVNSDGEDQLNSNQIYTTTQAPVESRGVVMKLDVLRW